MSGDVEGSRLLTQGVILWEMEVMKSLLKAYKNGVAFTISNTFIVSCPLYPHHHLNNWTQHSPRLDCWGNDDIGYKGLKGIINLMSPFSYYLRNLYNSSNDSQGSKDNARRHKINN